MPIRRSGHAFVRVLPGLLALCSVSASAANAAENPALPGMTYSSIEKLPDWSGWWTVSEAISAHYFRLPAPLRPEDAAKRNAARTKDTDPDTLRYCRPPRFVGYNGGFVDNVEFLFTPGRVTLTNEAGLIRPIYTDGRPLPGDGEATNTGTSVGHWEGQTLVVETIGLNPDATFPDNGEGASKIGKNVKLTERMTLQDANTLVIELTTIAPDLFTRPDQRTRVYSRAPGKTTAREVTFCVDHDRSIDPKTGKQRFDMTPPADLPPPPPK